MLSHPKFLASQSVILDMKINPCTMPYNMLVSSMLGRMDEHLPLLQTSQRLPPYMLHSRDCHLIQP